MTETIRIDPEFQALLPALSTEALHELEQSLVTEGCREPLVAWRHEGKLILLDGHSRRVICEAHGIKCKVAVKTTKDIPDRDAAVDWILRNQLARRNLTPEQFALYLGKLYNAQRAAHGGDRKSTGQNVHLIGDAAEKLAKEHGVNERTVRRAGEFADAVEKAKEQDPDIERKVVQGKVSRKEVMAKAKPAATPEKQEPPKDADGMIVPEDLRPIFAEAEQFEAFAKKASHLKGEFASAFKANPAAWVHLEPQRVLADLSMLHQRLMESRPYLICPVCGGEDPQRRCRQCGGLRWLSRHAARSVALDLRNPQREAHGLHLLEKASQKAGE